MHQILADRRVAIAATGRPDYDPDGTQRVWRALERAARFLGWGEKQRGPFAALIRAGSRVTIKPNLVYHENQAPFGIDPLLTHRSILDAAFRAAQLAGASEIVVGDAPIQSCDFASMLHASGLDEWARQASESFPGMLGIRDFRRTVSRIKHGVRQPLRDMVSADRFALFDLGVDSMLEPVTDRRNRFRVTCYEPHLLQKTHTCGRHQYLVSKDVLLADVVINLPKLKMHKKAGITCALKNLVGINGNKEFLPHHRTGGSHSGGDCYPGASRMKSMLEYALDRQNGSTSLMSAVLWHRASSGLTYLLRFKGDHLGTEGSWSGNDTVWRMCLDLNRILLYGRPDGKMATTPQRLVIHFVDAVIAGQGCGPLAPEPFPLGLILLGQNAPAVDWVGALLLNYRPDRISLTRNAFGVWPWPLAQFGSSDVEVRGDLGDGQADNLFADRVPLIPSSYPPGWTDAIRETQLSRVAVR